MASSCTLLKPQIQTQSLKSIFTRECVFSRHSASVTTTITNHHRCLHRPHSSLSPASPPKPPSSKEEAISQARTCLATTLQKPISNPRRRLTTKFKRQKQPRFRVEIPVTDDSPESTAQLALQIFRNLPIKRKGSPIKTLLVWPTSTSREAGVTTFKPLTSTSIHHTDLGTASTRDTTFLLDSAELAVFLAPESSQLSDFSVLCDSIDPTPVVIFNPKWAFDEEEEIDLGGLKPFVRSFEVVYAFLGLEVRGILSKKRGVLFKCARDGVAASDESWNVFVEEEGGGGGELKVVSKFKSRPSMVEVETVLYNLMAVNSPITKSAKFFRDLVSNVTGKK